MASGETFLPECYLASESFGIEVPLYKADQLTGAQVANPIYRYQSDADKIAQLTDPETYVMSSIITCVRGGKIIGQRLSVSNSAITSNSKYTRLESTGLTTYGSGSRYAD